MCMSKIVLYFYYTILLRNIGTVTTEPSRMCAIAPSISAMFYNYFLI